MNKKELNFVRIIASLCLVALFLVAIFVFIYIDPERLKKFLNLVRTPVDVPAADCDISCKAGECKAGECKAGEYVNCIDGSCLECPKDTYMPHEPHTFNQCISANTELECGPTEKLVIATISSDYACEVCTDSILNATDGKKHKKTYCLQAITNYAVAVTATTTPPDSATTTPPDSATTTPPDSATSQNQVVYPVVIEYKYKYSYDQNSTVLNSMVISSTYFSDSSTDWVFSPDIIIDTGTKLIITNVTNEWYYKSDFKLKITSEDGVDIATEDGLRKTTCTFTESGTYAYSANDRTTIGRILVSDTSTTGLSTTGLSRFNSIATQNVVPTPMNNPVTAIYSYEDSSYDSSLDYLDFLYSQIDLISAAIAERIGSSTSRVKITKIEYTNRTKASVVMSYSVARYTEDQFTKESSIIEAIINEKQEFFKEDLKEVLNIQSSLVSIQTKPVSFWMINATTPFKTATEVLGCMESSAKNYDPLATRSSGCVFE